MTRYEELKLIERYYEEYTEKLNKIYANESQYTFYEWLMEEIGTEKFRNDRL
jgi:hypothetical protein